SKINKDKGQQPHSLPHLCSSTCHLCVHESLPKSRCLVRVGCGWPISPTDRTPALSRSSHTYGCPFFMFFPHPLPPPPPVLRSPMPSICAIPPLLLTKSEIRSSFVGAQLPSLLQTPPPHFLLPSLPHPCRPRGPDPWRPAWPSQLGGDQRRAAAYFARAVKGKADPRRQATP
ncbi:hypothetical protein EJB05_46831, partial [Eragrostis curvula]